MSLQIIISCHRVLAESHVSPQISVCVSPNGVAEELEGLVGQMSAYALREGNGGHLRYSYRVRQIAGMEYHILSRSVVTGEKEEKRVIHALLLSQEEVAVLRANAARPTPSGIMLALENKLFWRTELPDSATELDEEPTMTASALPNASTQVLWKRYTGHKGNARALFTPPYEGECMLVFPQGMRQEEVLGLLNESDWLTADRGWGHTFTTLGTSLSQPNDTSRIAIPETCPRHTVPAWAAIPVLRIAPDMALGDPGQVPVLQKVERHVGHTPVPYHYYEADDNDTYPYTRPPLARFQRLLIIIGGLLLLSFCINLLVYGKVDEAGALAGKAITQKELPGTPAGDREDVAEFSPPAQTEAAPSSATPKPPAALEKMLPPAPLQLKQETNQEPPSPAAQTPPPPQPYALKWCSVGKKLPEEAQNSLSRGLADVTVYLLGTKGEACHGALIPGKSPHSYHLQGGRKDIDIEIACDGSVLRSISHQGEPAAVLLRLRQTSLLLLPRPRCRFGEIINRPALPEGRFNIKPRQLRCVFGDLLCSDFPTFNKGKLVHTENKVSIVLPLLKNIRYSLSFEYEEGKLPLDIRLDPSRLKRGCYVIPVKLMLAYPSSAEMESWFREITQAELSPQHGGCTCATLFALAEKLAEKPLSEEELRTYTSWREEAGKFLPDLPVLSDPQGGDASQAKKIRTTVCAYINNSLTRCWNEKKEQLETFDKKVELQLEKLDLNDEGELRWIFVLREEAADTHEP